jgi:hypothetical protein
MDTCTLNPSYTNLVSMKQIAQKKNRLVHWKKSHSKSQIQPIDYFVVSRKMPRHENWENQPKLNNIMNLNEFKMEKINSNVIY